MPSSQTSQTPMGQPNLFINKDPPQHKPPPPPPLSPPPPPPRNSAQLMGSSNLNTINQLCNGLPVPTSSLNNGSSMNSLNSAGRCSHTQSLGVPAIPSAISHGQRNFMKQGDNCSSRSSVSSHSSLQHHHSMNHNVPGNGGGVGGYPIVCSHVGHTCACSSSIQQHNHPMSSSLSDCGSCVHHHNPESRNLPQQSGYTGCCLANNNNHHTHKCQPQIMNPIGNMRTNNMSNSATTTIGRNALFYNSDNTNGNIAINGNGNGVGSGGCGGDVSRHCMGAHSGVHHHHHHNIHTGPMSSPNISSMQPVDQNNQMPFHRCVSQSSTNSSLPGIIGDQSQRPLINHHCNHIHRADICNHYHTQTFCDHHMQTVTQSLPGHQCGNCSQANNIVPHHDCNSALMMDKSCLSSSTNQPHQHHHFDQEPSVANHQSPIASNNDSSLVSTAHAHNLSNSSTTTHTSNVAVKHQPQYHRPALSRGARSNSSQQYDYGPSSVASTSSANASLSSYNILNGSEDLQPLYPTNKNHQPLPPPPPPLPPSKTGLQLPAHLIMKNNNNSAINSISSLPGVDNMTNNDNNIISDTEISGSNQTPLIATTFIGTFPNQGPSINQSLPPLPPKPISPSASSCISQITSLKPVSGGGGPQSSPITRLTYQAGVQKTLPSSDIPPPVTSLNLNSRIQPSSIPSMIKLRSGPPLEDASLNQIIPNFGNLSLSNNNINNNNNISNTNNSINNSNIIGSNNNNNLGYNLRSEAERKTEALTRQVELELEMQQKSGEPLGICPKCCKRVMPAQDACKAMDKIYHASCFVCCECGRTLRGKTFYPVGDKVYCEEDYDYIGHMQSVERCAECSQPIYNMILPALNKFYHPECFKCCICGQCLDGLRFTIDGQNKIYCVTDYHRIYSPKCDACGKAISPIDGTEETVRVVSMDKNYHIDCYCCEDCGQQLTDEEPSQSYPLDNHLLCQKCHIKRRNKMT